jgi:hypothetical protein
VRRILATNLNMKMVWEKVVPRNVNGNQNLARLQEVSETLEEIGYDASILNTDIYDENCLLYYDAETKSQLMQLETAAPARPRKLEC